MKVRLEQFCEISTSMPWQHWLYNYSHDMYKELIKHLRASSGCGANKEKMRSIFERIQSQPGGSDKLLSFLREKYPHVLIDDIQPVAISPPVGLYNRHKVFEYYNPKLLTYPRRQILTGHNLVERVQTFIRDKAHVEFLILDDQAYIEYLLPSERHLKDTIPHIAWQVVQYKSNHL